MTWIYITILKPIFFYTGDIKDLGNMFLGLSVCLQLNTGCDFWTEQDR